MLYLHVVDYNNIAIKFYSKNGFKFFKKIFDHYTIFDSPYDAIILYKELPKLANEAEPLPAQPRSWGQTFSEFF